MKKRLLFVIDSLDVAGAEKSLVTLLNLLDFTRYDVDLQLFAHGHMLEKLVPKEVRVLKPFIYTEFAALNLREAFIQAVSKSQFKMLSSRLKYSFQIRKGKTGNKQKARLFWQHASTVIEPNPRAYDVAIAYAQGVPTFYVAEKVKAKRKLAWVNVSYRLEMKEKTFQTRYYNKFDGIVAVSESAETVFLETFPEYRDKVSIQYDINNPEFIAAMAEADEGYQDGFDGIRLLTIGRLSHQKGYDVALETCRQLKQSGLHFKWYVLGKGPLQREMETAIKDMGLTEHFILLGVNANPYPYIKQADVYVQTSRFEGFGLAIAEARMLNVPVVTSEFDAVYNQMVNGENGLVVERTPEAVTKAIQQMIDDHALRSYITTYLTQEKKGNVEAIHGFYELIESS
ncbi:Amylovoran biosynthesis glycosyltransferase AmsK [Lentibacillus sp. JNUCC-1]|uniref:glycosyltransferase n=1 Tax=Lentibacillus sp. JNUCC-1 TaxID=2654513 RepID=UPI0012E9256B|nr:glycosyltransferase [Lentibacillus sp. JNUCC-1]MUV36905.1 Amylovoran biosynthesis glycosyltransferase AmsK [Lentibacillus sp. JNUCC-1]